MSLSFSEEIFLELGVLVIKVIDFNLEIILDSGDILLILAIEKFLIGLPSLILKLRFFSMSLEIQIQSIVI